MTTPVATLQLTFDDEFNSFDNSPNGTTGWETRLPYYGTASRNLSGVGEAEYYSDSSVGPNPFTDANGVLSITASTVAQTGANPLKEPYNSGAITTYHSFAQEYGYFEVNSEMPAGNGLWSAFWAAPTSLDGQSELDGYELLGNNTNQLYATTHSVINGVFTPNLQQLSVPNTAAGFHTYGFDWEPKTITWYEDGVAIATAPTPANMDETMFLILNLAVGGPTSWPGAPTSSSEFPASLKINYVHAYATANTKYVSGTDAIGLGAPAGEASLTGEVAVGIGVGTAIQGVTVSIVSSAGAILQTTTTDSFGRYQFINLDPGAYQVRMTPPSFYAPQSGSSGILPVTLTAGEAGQLATLKLQTSTAGSIAGSLLLNSGSSTNWASGITITLLASTGAAVARTTTDGNGDFSFNNLAAGTYQVKYTAPSGEVLQSGPGGTGGLTNALTIVAGQTLTLSSEILTSVAGTITGSTLLGTAAQPGVTIALLSSSNAVIATATSDSNGAFSFGNIAAGTYQVQYSAPSGEMLQSGPGGVTGLTGSLTVAAGQTLTLPAEVLAPAPGAITGSTLFGGAGQAGIVVTLLNSGTAVSTTTTDGNGAFSFANIAAGTYQVQYAAPSGEVLQSGPGGVSGLTGSLAVAAGQTLALAAESLAPAPGTITGATLLGGAGQAGIIVTLLNSGTAVSTTTTDGNGAFSFANIAAGTYQVQYAAPSGEVLQSGPGNTSTGLTGSLTVAAGQNLTLAAETLALATGAVIGSTRFGSTALAGVTVKLLTGTTTFATTTTAANGNYAFTGVAPNYYLVQYLAPAGDIIQSGPVNPTTGDTGAFGVTPGVTRTIGTVTFAPAYAALTGSVLFAGAGQPGVAVALQNSSGGVVATTATDANGAFSFANLAAGLYALAYTAPTGEMFQSGDPANTTTGVTGLLTLVAGQTLAAAPEHVLLSPVSLMMNGKNVTLTEGNAPFIVTGAPSGSTLTLGNADQNVTLGGFSNTVTLGNGNDIVSLSGSTQTLQVGNGSQALTLTGNFDTVTLGNTPAGQSSIVTANGTGEVITGGNGNVTVTGPVGSNIVTLGNGDDTVTLTGSHNTITVGAGTSVINAGSNSEIIHAAGGNVTVTVGGQSNLVDIGPGAGVINAGSASRLNTFLLNGINQGLTIINGFNNSAGDVLDLTRTLAGTGLNNSTLSNIGSYVTASASGGNTTLYIAPATGGASSAFAELTGTTTTVAQLLANQAFTVS